MPKLTISYRRKDSDAITGRIRDRLAQHFGEDFVFMDIDNIPLGLDFRKQIQQALRENQILLVVIGPNWLGPIESGPSRILDPTDPVRIEVETALQRGIPTIPVLVGGASMPKSSDLPETLQELPYYNAAEVSSGLDFHPHVDRLIRAIEQIIREKGTGSSNRSRHFLRNLLITSGVLIACAILIAAAIGYRYWWQAPGPSLGAQATHTPPPVKAVSEPQLPQGSALPTTQTPPPVKVSEPQPSQGPGESATQAPSVKEPQSSTTPPSRDGVEAEAAASRCDAGSVSIFYDNFKVIDTAWDGLSTDSHTDSYLADGRLIMAPPPEDFALLPRKGIFRNTSICAQVISPPTIKDLLGPKAGVVFWASDDRNFYDAIVYPDGRYEIDKWVKGSRTTISQEKNDAVKTGSGAVNEIKLSNANDNNTLFINNRKMKEFKGQPGKDDIFVGLIAASESAQRDEWRFSEIVMTQPNLADEFTDFGVGPQSVLQRNVGSKTPTTIPGAQVITTSDLYAAIQRGSLDGSPFLLIDVLFDPHDKTIRGAKRIPKGGVGGDFDDDAQQYLRTQLNGLTKNNLTMPMVFFCEGSKCWESYNACLRAEKMGFTRIFWYRGGLNTWKAAGLPMN